MMQVGNFNGDEPQRSHEERSHFGLWSINSAPLVLGFDLGNNVSMDRVWPIISNQDALSVNEQWAGHPGTLVKAYPASDMDSRMVIQAGQSEETDPAPIPGAVGWHIANGKLVAPGSDADPQCLSASGFPNGFYCPPTTRAGGVTQCGNLIENCSTVQGSWEHGASGLLMWRQKPSDQPQCLFTDAGSPAAKQRQTGWVKLGQCQSGSSHQTFSFTKEGELRNDDDVFLKASALPGSQLWSKPLLDGKVAILVLNPLYVEQELSVPFDDVPQNPCAGSCTVRDVWQQQDSVVHGSALSLKLAPHESAYFVLSKSTVELI
jgi:hypothetical protein